MNATSATPSSSSFDLGVAICSHNSARTIARTIRSVHGLARRIVVVDSGSTDRTVDICRDLGAHVIPKPWQGHVVQKQFSIDQCRDCAWTLLLDSDESLEPALIESMRATLTKNDSAINGWFVNRKVWFLGGWLNHTYQPEWRLRLFRSDNGIIAGVDPHDRVDVDGETGRLKGDVRHDAWLDMTDVAMRQLRYAQIAEKEAQSGGSMFDILIRPPASLFKQLILKRGFMDGWRGVIIAGMTANGTMLKHAFIAARKVTKRAGNEGDNP